MDKLKIVVCRNVTHPERFETSQFVFPEGVCCDELENLVAGGGIAARVVGMFYAPEVAFLFGIATPLPTGGALYATGPIKVKFCPFCGREFEVTVDGSRSLLRN